MREILVVPVSDTKFDYRGSFKDSDSFECAALEFLIYPTSFHEADPVILSHKFLQKGNAS